MAMIDPKYAHLPGIDTSQRDVFETSDLPESDQPDPAAAAESETAEQLEVINVNVKDVYGKFRDKRIDSSRVDFSDTVGLASKTGYDHVEARREDETLEMRFRRLQMEMHELSEDLGRAEQAAVDDSKSSQISPAALHQNVVALQGQLNSMQLQKNVGGNFVNLSDPTGNVQEKLLSQIKQIKGAPKKGEKSATGKACNNPVYELYEKPDADSFEHTSRVATLEQRLAKLESILGSNPEKLAVLKGEGDADGLLGAVDNLRTKINLLNPKMIDQVDGRLGALQLRLQQIGEKRAAIASSEQLPEDTAMRIKEIHETMEKWEALCSTLPNISDRMTTLNELHHQATNFGQTLQQLEAMQKTISGNLTTQSALVSKVQSTLAENLEVIQKNCTALDARISKLKK